MSWILKIFANALTGIEVKINLIEYFERTALDKANRIAVIEGEKTIDFKNLRNRSINTALAIVDCLRAQKNIPIAVFLPKSIDSVIANLAITYSGNIYMNLDVKSPDMRLEGILGIIQPELIITNAENFELLSRISNIPLLDLQQIGASPELNSEQLLRGLDCIIDTDPLCIINTSGSTGVPKGVVLNHRSFFDFTEWALNTFDFDDNEIIGSLSPLVFDIYSFELCMMMAKGSTLILIPETLSAFPVNILKLLQEHSVSFIFWVPTIMVNIANMNLISRMPLPSLKIVWFAGEVFPTKQFNYWKANLPNAKFVNMYGPIEITLDCTYFIVNRELKDEEPIPIGYPCRNTDILILNDSDKQTLSNEIGELCVRGTSLAMGYYNNPEKTKSAFVQNPLNTSYPEIIYRTGDMVFKNDHDEIIFKGRKDSMIKHLGYRIELGEIEHVIINTFKMVKNGCVVYDNANKQIVLFYESESELAITEFRKSVASIFPKYMIPGVLIKKDELPRNANGKIDRLFLNKQANP